MHSFNIWLAQVFHANLAGAVSHDLRQRCSLAIDEEVVVERGHYWDVRYRLRISRIK